MDLGFGIWDVRMWDSGCGMLDLGFGIWDFGRFPVDLGFPGGYEGLPVDLQFTGGLENAGGLISRL